jgi:acyl-CoA-binding protein
VKRCQEQETMSTSDLHERFETAAQEAQELPKRPDDRTLLKLYALYKQATLGDVSGDRPGIGDLVERFKYDAWARVRGTSNNEAKQAYVDLVEILKTQPDRGRGMERSQ